MASDVFILNGTMRCLLVISLIFVSCTNCQNGLYAPEEGVKVLDVNNFNSTVFESQNAWLIEFYSSWCGHCIRFAPTWKKLATSVKEWKPVVTVAAINCADEKNGPTCRRYDITSYPTVKFFPGMSGPKENGTEFTGTNSIEHLKNFMVYRVETQSASDRPSSWPKLHLLPKLEKIWDDVGPRVQKTVLFVEGDTISIGREIILELSKYHPALLIRRMQREAVAKFAVKNVPAAYLIDQGGTFQPIISKTTMMGFVSALRSMMGPIADLRTEQKKKNPMVSTEDIPVEQLGIAKSVGLHVEDLESALHYSLRQEIAMTKVIQGEKLKALKDYIAILAKYYPGRETTSVYFQSIKAMLAEDVGESITGEKWLSDINDLQTEDIFLPSKVKWIGCAGSSPRYRGYPCGLWTLFHTLTVTAALRQEAEPVKDFNPQEVLLAMRGYIKNFFGCRECSENFGKVAVTIEERVKSGNDAVLWLWRAHNKANRRLHGDPSEDPNHPKMQYPSQQICEKCWKEELGKKVFNQAAVLKFLKKVYSDIKKGPEESDEEKSVDKSVEKNDVRRSPKVVTSRRKSQQPYAKDYKVDQEKIQRWKDIEKQTRLKASSSASWGFTSLDMSLCVVFYIVCTMIVCLLYLHVAVHRKKSIFAMCRRNSKLEDDCAVARSLSNELLASETQACAILGLASGLLGLAMLLGSRYQAVMIRACVY